MCALFSAKIFAPASPKAARPTSALESKNNRIIGTLFTGECSFAKSAHLWGIHKYFVEEISLKIFYMEAFHMRSCSVKLINDSLFKE